MRSRIKQLFSSPVFEDEDKTRVANLLSVTLLTLFLIAITRSMLSIWASPEYLAIVLRANVVLLGVMTCIFVLMRAGKVHLACVVFTLCQWVGIAWLTYHYGGVRLSIYCFFIFVIFTSGLLLGGKWALSYATISIIYGTFMLYLERHGVIFPRVENSMITFSSITPGFISTAVFVYLYSRDITRALTQVNLKSSELTTANEQLVQSLSLLRATLESTADGILVVDRYGKIISYNHKFQEMWDIPCSVLQRGADDLALAHVLDNLLDPDAFIAGVQALYTQPEAESFDVIRLRNGRTFERYSQPQKIDERIVGRVWSFRDSTERMRAEEALMKERDFATGIISMTPAIICGITPDGTTTFINAAGERITEYSASEIIGKDWWRTLYPGDDNRQAQELLRDFKQSDLPDYEMPLTTRSGEKRTVSWNSLNRINASGAVEEIIGFGNDITERKRNEIALRESEERYRSLFSSLQEGLCLFDIIFDAAGNPADYRFLELNPAFERMSGLSRDELIGKTIGKIFPQLEAYWLEQFSLTASTGNPTTLANHTRLLDRYLEIYAYSPAIGRQIAIILSDVTEKRNSQEDREKNQRLEALGVLAGGIAHDFNNILTAIIGNISLARLQVGEEHKAATRLVACENAMTRATDLTKQLLTFSRGGAPHKSIMDMKQLMSEVLSFAFHGSNCRADVALEENLWSVDADANQLHQVFNNLLINAIQASLSGGIITIKATNWSIGAGGHASLLPGPYVKIAISDHGCGIPPEILPRIFDPYFTTKSTGSGLGLTSAYSIIKKHDGYINASSSPGRGTTFEIFLPAAAETPVKKKPESESLPVVVKGATVLVMDDEEMIRTLVAGMLEQLGYQGIACCDGAEAVNLYRDYLGRGAPFAAVILDMTIPGGKGGKEVAEEILSLDPDAVLIISSGYSTESVFAGEEDAVFQGVVPKPYNIRQLALELARLIIVPN